MKTLLLDRTAWDLVIDAAGNVAVAKNPYAAAQDIAAACRTFLGEVYYDTTLGVPYWQSILGQWPPIQLIQSDLEAQALTVPTVSVARCQITSLVDRAVTGTIYFETDDGSTGSVDISTVIPATTTVIPDRAPGS